MRKVEAVLVACDILERQAYLQSTFSKGIYAF